MSKNNFKHRVQDFWKTFEKEEANIRKMMLDKVDGNTLVEATNSILTKAFHNINFEMGINNEDKHELILSPNGNRVLLMQIRYCLSQKPASLDKHWNFYSSKPAQGSEGMRLNIYGIEISADDFHFYPDLNENKKIINIEILAPKIYELDDSRKYNTLFIMLDLFIGELYTMEYIGAVDIIDEERNDQDAIPLSKMKSYIEYLINEHDWVKTEDITKGYVAYKLEEDASSTNLRKDVFIGYTSCFDLIRNLNDEDVYPIQNLEEDGVFMGYIYYDNSTVDQKNMVPQRAEIEDEIIAITEKDGIAESTGGATGSRNSYIDFIIYDFDAFIEIAKEVMDKYDFGRKGFGFFQSKHPNINLK